MVGIFRFSISITDWLHSGAAAFGPSVMAGLPQSIASPAAMLENVTKQRVIALNMIKLLLGINLDETIVLTEKLTNLTQNNIDDARKLLERVDGFSLDYLEAIDEQSFNLATPDAKNKRLIIAGWVNQVRLIDNMAMGSKR
jgi:pantothenate synthetase